MKSLLYPLTLAIILLLLLPGTVSATGAQRIPYSKILDLEIFSEGPTILNAEDNQNLAILLRENPPTKYSIVTVNLLSLPKTNWETSTIIDNKTTKINFENNKDGSSSDEVYTYKEYKIYKTDPTTNEKVHIGHAGISTNIRDSTTSLWAYFEINDKVAWLHNINQQTNGKCLGLLTKY